MPEAAQPFSIPRVLGRFVLDSAAHVGRLSLMVVEMLRALREYRIWFPRAITEAWNIGVGSLFIVILIAGFAGAVTALQLGYQLQSKLPLYSRGTLRV